MATKSYRIENTTSGHVFGEYRAETAEEAIASMMKDAGSDEDASDDLEARDMTSEPSAIRYTADTHGIVVALGEQTSVVDGYATIEKARAEYLKLIASGDLIRRRAVTAQLVELDHGGAPCRTLESHEVPLCQCGDYWEQACECDEAASRRIRFVPDHLQGTASAAGTKRGCWTTIAVAPSCADLILAEASEWVESVGQ